MRSEAKAQRTASTRDHWAAVICAILLLLTLHDCCVVIHSSEQHPHRCSGV
jgi:hypothetical protein